MPQHVERSHVETQTRALDEEQARSVSHNATEHSESLDALDAVLDDIETTLETNAQEYVSSFVQKGGE